MIARRILHGAAILTVAYILVSVLAAVALASLALHPSRRSFDLRTAAELPGPVRPVSISAADGAALRGWYVHTAAPNGGAVILLHGVGDNREGMLGFAQIFLSRGYSVLLPDSRAHGISGGAIPTYGVLERDDVRRWAAWLHSRNPGCEYLFGESMGAAIAIEASAVTPHLCAIAAESAFSTFRGIAADRIAEITHTGLWFSRTLGLLPRELALGYVDLVEGVNLANASPLSAIRQARVPTLLIAGTADGNIPARHSAALYAAGRSHSELWIVEGAQHTGARSVDPVAFDHRIFDWFGAHASPE